MKTTFLILCFALFTGTAISQSSISGNNTPLYINIYIFSDRSVNVNQHLNVPSYMIKRHVKEILENHPFVENELLVYRVYASGELKLGDIMDVEQEINTLYPAKHERYLLVEKENRSLLDTPDWIQNLKKLKFKKLQN